MAWQSGWKPKPRRKLAAGGIAAGADTGSTTVFFFGSHELPRFRWVASRRGRASCKRHYGAGHLFDPTACKVTQPCCDADSPDPRAPTNTMSQTERNYRGKSLTIEPSCKDEARVGQQGTLTRIWARRGARPRALRDRRFNWAYLFGAICPARGVGAALVLPTVNVEAMNKHLAEIGKCIGPGAIALLIVDGAG
jgi:hypothetical protein